jgi:uncharacterized protein
MSEENIAVVRQFYEAWSQDDFPGPVELLHPEVEYVNPEGAIEPGTRRGVAEFVGTAEKLLDAWEHWRPELERVEAVGDQVVAVVRYTARGRGSGVEVEGTESSLWTFRDGKVIRYQWFHGAEDADAAAS